MDIVKNNILSIVFGVVALVAIIAYFWPVGGYYSNLEASVTERAGAYNQLNQLQTRQRRMPIVDPDNAEQEQLTRFPSRSVIEKGKEVTEQVEQESLRMLQLAVEINRRQPLVANAFPRPQGIAMNQFRQAYRVHFEQVIPQRILQSGTPPAQFEYQQAEAELRERLNQQIITRAGQPINQQEIERQFQEEASRLPEKLRTDIAQRSRIYLDPGALAIDERVFGPMGPEGGRRDAAMGGPAGRFGMGGRFGGAGAGGRAEVFSPEEMWYAQVSLWIQEDVARALAGANANSQNVMDAIVKRLISIDIARDQQTGNPYVIGVQEGQQPGGFGGMDPMMMDPGMGMGMGGFNGGMTPGAAPAEQQVELPVESTQPLPTDFAMSPTGRVCNPLFDVVHFTLMIDVDAERVPQVIHELQRGRFVTVRGIQELTRVDSAYEQIQGYLYGTRPVVRLTLDCETLFLREWTRALMPAGVKRVLAGQQQQQAGW
jgi:hypothetical protein